MYNVNEALIKLSPVDRGVGDVMIDELAPLHHHERVPHVRSRDVVVNVDGHQPRAETDILKRGIHKIQ